MPAVALLIKPLPLLSPFSHGRQIGQDIFTAGSYARHSILRLLHWPVFFAGKNYAPTISLDVKFIRPVKVGDRMLVTAKAVATGRRITQLTCEAYSEQTGKLVASGASVYMNVDTTKEHQNSEQDPSDQ